VDTALVILEVLALLGIAAVGFLARLPRAYTDKKGENLATLEDITKITDKIEAVRAEYAKDHQRLVHDNSLLVERMQQRHQLSIAALDKRLEAHQQAFTRWRKLLSAAHGNAPPNTILENFQWWEENCLYLAPAASHAFVVACNAAAMHKDLQGPEARQYLRQNWDDIAAAGKAIADAVQLPGLDLASLKDAQPPT
jgi:hypothetical protein